MSIGALATVNNWVGRQWVSAGAMLST